MNVGKIGTLVIFPKGTLYERISTMLSVKVISEYMNINIQMIWDHDIPYHVLFLDNIGLVKFEYFTNKNYIYNPNMNQKNLLDTIEPDINSDIHWIIESNKELIHKDMSLAEYELRKQYLYSSLLKNNINGMISGQLNLFDIPKSPYCFLDNIETKIKSKLKQLPMLNDGEFPDAKNKELQEYLHILIYSKATCLVCTGKFIPEIFIKASKISLNPIICLNNEVENNSMTEYNSCVNYMGYPLIINPVLQILGLF